MQIKRETEWVVTGKLFGKAKSDAPGEFHHAKDISGISCDRAEGFPRNGIVIDDESQAAQMVLVNDGELVAGKRIALIDDTFEGKPLELDGEGVAFESGYFYVIGSHGHPRDQDGHLDPVADAATIAARISACSRIFQIGAQAPHGIKGTTALKDIFRRLPELEPFIDQPLDRNGLTVEGLAVKNSRAYVGLRSPLIGGKSTVVSVALTALFGELPSTDTSVMHLDLGGRGIRDIAVDGAGFLILAGPSANEVVSFAIFEWDGGSGLSKLVELPAYPGIDERPGKPEGILPLDSGPDGRRILILLDTAPGGAPRALLIGE
jgi:hypothetical protein